MDLDEVRAFIAVADLGSIQTAARALRTPRATIARRVDALEARIGRALLYRDSSGARLTEVGHAIASRGRLLIRDADEFISRGRASAGATGRLRLLIPVGIAPWAHVAIMRLVTGQLPQVTWQVTHSPDPLSENLNEFDLVTHVGPRRPPSDWKSVHAVHGRERLFASAAYLAERGVPQSVDALAEHDLLAWQRGNEDPSIWHRTNGEPFQVEPRITDQSVYFVAHMVNDGLGIALIPDAERGAPGLEDANFVPVLDSEVGRTFDVYVSVPRVLEDLPALSLIWEMMRALGPSRLGD